MASKKRQQDKTQLLQTLKGVGKGILEFTTSHPIVSLAALHLITNLASVTIQPTTRKTFFFWETSRIEHDSRLEAYAEVLAYESRLIAQLMTVEVASKMIPKMTALNTLPTGV